MKLAIVLSELACLTPFKNRKKQNIFLYICGKFYHLQTQVVVSRKLQFIS